jgi:hypothetical protein
MNFDKAIILTPDGREKLVSPSEFLAIPLGERIELLTASKIKFYRGGQIISPLDAVRRPK